MADDLAVKVDVAALTKAMEVAPAALYSRLKKRIGGEGGVLSRWLRQTIVKGRLSGEPLHARTGSMRRSFVARTRGSTIDDLEFVAGSFGLPYPPVHEFGGTIRPKRAQYLAVPLDAAKTQAGVTRRPPREWDNTFVRRTQSGSLIIFQTRGEQVIPLFALVKEVTIPPRLGFFAAFDAFQPALATHINEAIGDALGDIGDGK